MTRRRALRSGTSDAPRFPENPSATGISPPPSTAATATGGEDESDPCRDTPTNAKKRCYGKILPPHNYPLAALAAEEGISEATLHHWRREARIQGRLLPDGASRPAGWSAADKFAAVVESAALNAAELGEYCRQRGLYA
jgi:transposase-like protein